MATTKFTDIDAEIPAEAVKAEAPKTETTALATQGGSEVSVPRDEFFSNEGFEGHTDRSALEIPRITLVHSVGDLSANFEPGSIVLNGEKKLELPLEVIPLKINNFVQEYIPYNDEERKDDIPKRWKTPEDARRDGFVYVWEKDREDKDTPTCENAAVVDLLLKGYPAIADLCPVEIAGIPDTCFMPVRLFIKGKQHKLIYNKLLTQSQFSKGAHPSTFRWKIKTVRGKEGQNWVWRMHVELAGKNQPEVVTQLKSLLG